jgi:hypothetical protein
MPKAALHTLRWLPAHSEYVCLAGCQQVGIVTSSDHAQLQRWLCGVDSFAFHGCAGAYTVRRERIRGGNSYWYAYRRVEGRVHKQYLGKSEAITVALLERVAAQQIPQAQGQPGIRVYQGQAYIALGAVEYEWNHLQQAEEYIHRGIELCHQFGITESLIAGLGTLAKIRLAQGDDSAARTFLRGDKRLANVERESANLGQLVNLWRARLALVLDETMDAQRWMQTQMIRLPLPPTFSPKLEEYALFQAKMLLCLDCWWEAEPILHSCCSPHSLQSWAISIAWYATTTWTFSVFSSC